MYTWSRGRPRRRFRRAIWLQTLLGVLGREAEGGMGHGEGSENFVVDLARREEGMSESHLMFEL